LQIQNTFFERAANAVTRRESMYSFLTLTGAASLLLWGGKGAKELKLPITVGPQAKAPLGPRDKL
jgi:photosystem I subunit 6